MRHLAVFFLFFLLTVTTGMPVFAQSAKTGLPVNQTTSNNLGTIKVVIEPVFNGRPLVLDRGVYINEHGDTLNISLFKFYITHTFFGYDRPVAVGSGVHNHLFDAEDTASYSFSFSTLNPSGDKITDISFVLGVDSADNTNGANADDLDPAKGMYWAWNTGYIMAKIEGTSKVCNTLHHVFEFHIGGYMPPYNTDRRIVLKLPKPIQMEVGKTKTIRLWADVAAWFSGGLDLSKTNSILIPGKEAGTMADRYSKMFTAEEVNP